MPLECRSLKLLGRARGRRNWRRGVDRGSRIDEQTEDDCREELCNQSQEKEAYEKVPVCCHVYVKH